MIRLFSLLALSTALSAALSAAEAIALDHAWARATTPTARNGAAFLTLANPTSAPVKLIAAAAPAICDRVELHTHTKRPDGTMAMEQVPAITAAPGATVVLQPGGLHLMLMDLKVPLKEGSTITVLATVEGEAKPREVAVRVGAIDAMGPAEGGTKSAPKPSVGCPMCK